MSQPGPLFALDPRNGYTGLLTGRKAVVVYTSAVYGDGHDPRFGVDFQAPYNECLRWAGVRDVSEVYLRPNLATADADAARHTAHAAACEAAKAL